MFHSANNILSQLLQESEDEASFLMKLKQILVSSLPSEHPPLPQSLLHRPGF